MCLGGGEGRGDGVGGGGPGNHCLLFTQEEHKENVDSL